MAPNPPFETPKPPGPIHIQWCSNKEEFDVTFTPNAGEGQTAFVERFVAWADAELHEHKPTNDCTPPFP